MVTPGDAKQRRLVRLPDGRVGRLTYAPVPLGEPVKSPPFVGRGGARGRKATVVVANKHVKVDAGLLTTIKEGEQ